MNENKYELAQQKIADFIPSEPEPVKDWQFGGLTNLGAEPILQPDGKWHLFLPEAEKQYNKYIDVMACVTYSGLNIFEMLSKRTHKKLLNKSDRFCAKMNGTSASGNTFQNFAESFRKDGAVEEHIWPFDKDMDWNKYYAAIPQNIINLGLEFLKEWQINHEYVAKKDLSDGLKYSPLHSAVCGWWKNSDGLYYSPSGQSQNHSVSLIGDYTKPQIEEIKTVLEKYELNLAEINLINNVNYPLIFDSYPPFIKILTPNHNLFSWGKRYFIQRLISDEPQEIKKNDMIFYQRPEKPELYQKGLGDGLYHHIIEEPIFRALYGKFSAHEIKVLNFSDSEIGDSIYFKTSFLKVLLDFLNKLRGK